MLAVFHPVLTHCATCVRSEVFKRCWIGCRSSHDNGVLKCAVLTEHFYRLSNGGTLLTNSDVDALHTQAALVDDGVDRDCGLTGLAVSNDQFALSTTDWGHGVDCFDTGLQRLVHWLAAHDAWRLNFYTS
ncbi:unannotated protein [freshwater metagenome]|uniref:Unannotated protein n=1 Tax=freshwater metagenome TaxID=449393 RepID=A0A6J7N170_9ZZZZ